MVSCLPGKMIIMKSEWNKVILFLEPKKQSNETEPEARYAIIPWFSSTLKLIKFSIDALDVKIFLVFSMKAGTYPCQLPCDLLPFLPTTI